MSIIQKRKQTSSHNSVQALLEIMAPQQKEILPDLTMNTNLGGGKELYGPYPKAVPVPFTDKDGTIPPAQDLEKAKSYTDLEKFPDYRDVGTPDEWLPRDGRLVRLTGRHPFNVEPPMSELRKTRFLTPSSLHYVRNHGACPRLTWDDHTILIGGSVSKPLELSMDELINLAPHRELPVTLVCAGNRRKEQNMIRQT
jgi:nitrate reductase (NAD(P)H)